MITLVLRHRLIFAPVLLSSVAKPFSGYEHIFRLYGLVDEFLPEERERMLKLAPSDAIADFTRLFSKRYFHIGADGYCTNDIERLTRSIPMEGHGMSRWDYEPDSSIPSGQLLAETILTCPFEGRDDRIAVLAKFTKLLGEEPASKLIKMLPEKGFKLEEIEEALQDSTYQGLLSRCRWVFGRTGNFWLDNDHGRIEWSRENVGRLTGDWPAYLENSKQMEDFDRWLKKDFPARCAIIINYVVGRVPKTLYEIFNGERP